MLGVNFTPTAGPATGRQLLSYVTFEFVQQILWSTSSSHPLHLLSNRFEIFLLSLYSLAFCPCPFWHRWTHCSDQTLVCESIQIYHCASAINLRVFWTSLLLRPIQSLLQLEKNTPLPSMMTKISLFAQKWYCGTLKFNAISFCLCSSNPSIRTQDLTAHTVNQCKRSSFIKNLMKTLVCHQPSILWHTEPLYFHSVPY